MFKPYLDEVVSQVPRLLGLMDRNVFSRTYGCFDRQYWHYKAIDFACARYQEAALTLALLYKTKGTPYYGKKKIADWARAAIRFWAGIQSENGAFSEWYPNEKSYVATAFTTAAVSEAMLVLGCNEQIDAVERAARWLMKRNEARVQNQESGAILALANASLLTGKKKYLSEARKKVKIIIGQQSMEGWWLEYGGFDIGYLSLTIDYLAKYYEKTKDKAVLAPINRAIEFISYFSHPNNTFGGEYGSRNTEYVIPSGLEIMKAGPALDVRKAVEKRTTISPRSLDDRYLCYIGYNWLQAYIKSGRIGNYVPKYEQDFIREFKEAKTIVLSKKGLYLIVNYGKGGAFKLFTRTKAIYDSGISSDGLGSLYMGSSDGWQKDNNIFVEGRLARIGQSTLTPFRNIGLRLFQLSLGRIALIDRIVKERLRTLLVGRARKSDDFFKRTFVIDEEKVIVRDEAKSPHVGEKYSFAYTPSSRYFQLSELDGAAVKKKGCVERVIPL